MIRLFKHIMVLYIYEDYKKLFPGIEGRQLTDLLIINTLKQCGVYADKILRTEKGKPYIERDTFGQCTYISVSHSGSYFVCLISDKPVGIDIQQQRKVKAENIAQRYFTEEEQNYIQSKGDEGFFFIWARKEAYSKYTGKGLEEIFKGINVLTRDDVEFIDFQLEKGMYCSCCIMI